MSLDSRHLTAFLAIVEHGSVGRAAAAFGLTQPALSRTLRKLETDLGAPLFERHTTGMVLTEYGATLLPRARLIAAESHRAVEDVRGLRGLSAGTLRLGAVASVLIYPLPAVLGRLLGRYPDLRVELTEAVEDRLVAALTSYDIDLAIGSTIEEDDGIALAGRLRWQDRTMVVAAPDHPLRDRPGLALADLRDAPWALTPPGTAPHDALFTIFRDAGLHPPRIGITSRSVLTLKALVAQVGYLSYLPRTLIGPERAAGTIDTIAVRGTAHPRHFAMYRRRHGYLPRPAEALVEALRQPVD
ncbi:MAG TPA: LysR family transcriptional regulator [Pseudonocardia sp.]|nr:LysR family transcriptional regulator [Pseudonocardia sp.]